MTGETLGTALPAAMARVRDEVMPLYRECGEVALPALIIMADDLDAAAQAMIEGDLVAMIRAYRALKSWLV